MPERTFRHAEAVRKKSGKSRSRFYADALEAFMRAETVHELEERYAEGYRRFPEDPAEIAAMTRQAAKAFKPEDW